MQNVVEPCTNGGMTFGNEEEEKYIASVYMESISKEFIHSFLKRWQIYGMETVCYNFKNKLPTPDEKKRQSLTSNINLMS